VKKTLKLPAISLLHCTVVGFAVGLTSVRLVAIRLTIVNALANAILVRVYIGSNQRVRQNLLPLGQH